jgi:hypothetical protein
VSDVGAEVAPLIVGNRLARSVSARLSSVDSFEFSDVWRTGRFENGYAVASPFPVIIWTPIILRTGTISATHDLGFSAVI